MQLAGTVFDVIEYFGEGVHRVCVLDSDRAFHGVISQSDALHFLSSRMDRIAFVVDRTLQELGLVDLARPPLTVPGHATVLEALTQMNSASVSSIAVVDNSGALLANLSMTDIKYVFQSGSLLPLHTACRDFVKDLRLRKDKENVFETKAPVFQVAPTSTLRRVISTLCATRAHRIWVATADTHRPVAVVSLTDVLRILTPRSNTYFASAPAGVRPVRFVPAV